MSADQRDQVAHMSWAHGSDLAIRREAHFGDRVVRCFADRTADLFTLFERAIASGADDEALVAGTVRLTYRELGAWVERVASGLARQGMERGDRLALVLGNRAEFVVAVLAALRVGAIAVPVGTRLAAAELRYVLEHCQAKLLVHDAEAQGAKAAAEGLSCLQHVIDCGTAGSDLTFGNLPLDEPMDMARPSVAEEDTAFLLYTSGTTGRPKGAMLTHLNVWHSLRHFELAHRLGPGERSLLAVPATHVTGLVAIVLSMINVGGTTLMLSSFSARRFIDLAVRERMTHTVLVPAMYSLLLLDPDFGRGDLSSWRLGSYGGAPMPESAIVALGERLPGLTLMNGYGATETSSPTSLTPFGQGLARRETIGLPVHCAEVIVADDRGREVPLGQVGELWIRGPMVVPGYWGDPAATAGSFTAGFWHSGDLGFRDTDGYLHLVDRKKDMINRGGYKVYSAEVENVLAGHPGVLECAVVAKPCPVLGERVHAYVSRTTPSVTGDELRAFCTSSLADYKVPESFTLLDQPLPRNNSGKILKRELRDDLKGAAS